jgi:methionine-rich copper-binding protein CopC
VRRFILLLGAVGAASLLCHEASAHAFLDHAVPPVGGTVLVPPKEIRLFFSEAIEPQFSRISLTAAGARPIKTGAPVVDAMDPMQFVLPVPLLAPGRYKVTWHVVSVDTHPTEGSFTFEIKP